MTDEIKDEKIIDFQKARVKKEVDLFENESRILSDIAKEVFDDTNALLKMNEKYAFIANCYGKPQILRYTIDPISKARENQYITVKELADCTADETVLVDGKPMPISKWWMGHVDKRKYERIVFDPNAGEMVDGCLNLWQGFGVKPTKGCWKKIRKHIWHILCNKDKEKFKYVIRWFAWAIQNPGQRAEVVLIFKGLQGVGKGVILNMFVKIFGRHGKQISNQRHLTGNFNEHLERLCFLFLDEAFHAGNKEAESVLKSIITEPTLTIEAKFKGVSEAPNRLHIVMATNEGWVVPISDDSRRFFINKVEDKYAAGRSPQAEIVKYFKALFHEIENGGMEAMLYDLIHLNLKDYHPRVSVPVTKELKEQSIISLGKTEKLMHSLLCNGIFPGVKTEDGEYQMTKKALYAYIEENQNEFKSIKHLNMDRVFVSLGIREHKKAKVALNYYVFPELGELRRRWNELHSNLTTEFDDVNEWRVLSTTAY